MGLAEQKQKQRIGDDPQNTNWSKDTSRFGFKMLEKMGWTAGKGLGAKGEGTVEHVKTVVKKNQHGLGFDSKTCDNWIENTSGFAQVLKKLNSYTAPSDSEDNAKEDDVSPSKNKKERKDKKHKKDKKRNKDLATDTKDFKKRKQDKVELVESKSDVSSKKSKKSKKDKTDDSEESVVKTKKSKKSKKDKKACSDNDDSPAPTSAPASRLSHRARFVQNKKLSTSDPSVLSAIFGIRA